MTREGVVPRVLGETLVSTMGSSHSQESQKTAVGLAGWSHTEHRRVIIVLAIITTVEPTYVDDLPRLTREPRNRDESEETALVFGTGEG